MVFLLLDNVIDINLQDTSIIVETNDIFFHTNLKNIDCKEFSIFLQVFDLNYIFSYQLDIFGEKLVIDGNIVNFEYDSILTNNVYPSIHPEIHRNIDFYKRRRASYLRGIKIEALLN